MQLLNNKKEVLYNLINHLKSDYEDISFQQIKKNNIPKMIAEKELSLILNVVSIDYIISIMYGRLFKVFSNHQSIISRNFTTNVSNDLGKDLLNKYHNILYNGSIESKTKEEIKSKNLTFSEWKKKNHETVSKINDNTLVCSIGFIMIEWMISCKLLINNSVKTDQNEYRGVLSPSKDVEITMPKGILTLPNNIPMIVKPSLYYIENIKKDDEVIRQEKLGGYLLNNECITNKIFIENPSLKVESSINNKNIIYDLVNNTSSIGFRINRDVYDYILGEGLEYLQDKLADSKKIDELSNKDNLTSNETKELQAEKSKQLLQENIMGLARVFYDLDEFYIPTRLDNRGRLYCTSEYLNYQSTELAKALLLFSKPGKMFKTDKDGINNLKVFGANCYGNKLDKESFNKRVEWVNKNYNDIINFKNGELIKKAENKFLFIAFCFEYNRWVQCESNIKESCFDTTTEAIGSLLTFKNIYFFPAIFWTCSESIYKYYKKNKILFLENKSKII